MKENKVYVVTSGSYSDYHIEGVFSTKERAVEYCEARNTDDSYDTPQIEEYELDVLKTPDGMAYWLVYKDYYEKGDVREGAYVSGKEETSWSVEDGVEESRWSDYLGQKVRRFKGVILAKGKQHALKILGEKTFSHNINHPLP